MKRNKYINLNPTIPRVFTKGKKNWNNTQQTKRKRKQKNQHKNRKKERMNK